jgi:ectoine hydroxylase-related dioxygenase (phytanoyl-CoA dioxygenase family)
MYSKNQKEYLENGIVKIPVFDKEYIEDISSEMDRLYSTHDETGPMQWPSRKSELIKSIVINKKLIKLTKQMLSAETQKKVDSFIYTQDWCYFKPPGELGRDVHQNVLYTHCNYGEYVNVIVVVDDSTIENGCIYHYGGSHQERVVYPVVKDEDRRKTNTKSFPHERGEPSWIPGNYVDGEWKEKYQKKYIPCQSGDVIWINSHLLHGSDDNISNKTRKSVLISYCIEDTYYNKGAKMKRKSVKID